MNDHIAKPFDPDDLFKLLGKWIKKPSGRSGARPTGGGGGGAGDLPETLKGIDVALGLKRARGNKVLYRNLLILLDEKYASAADEIEAMIEAGDRDGAMHLAHSVKGTSGMLGANELFEAAGRLEAALDAEEERSVANELAEFRVELGVVIGSVAVVKAAADEASLGHGGEVADAEELRKALDALKTPLSRGAPMECREGADGVRDLGWPSEMEQDVSQLLKYIEEYDFKKALALVEDLEARI